MLPEQLQKEVKLKNFLPKNEQIRFTGLTAFALSVRIYFF